VIIDTAGRLHTKVNLMNELSKIRRVIQKFQEDAPHEVMLVLDGSTGQNAVVQAMNLSKATEVDSTCHHQAGWNRQRVVWCLASAMSLRYP
jgi:fused signal recognition particle receptor